MMLPRRPHPVSPRNIPMFHFFRRLQWKLTLSYAVVTAGITGEITAEFGADGTLSGSDGCNQYSTTYTLDGDRITISPEIVTTRMACPSEEHTAQASQYAAALSAATTWWVDPVRGLELRDDTGALQVSFTASAA